VSQKAPSLPLTTRVVVLAQNKGSVGKSTLALCLLDLWIRNERKFQAIDGDSDHNTLTYAYEGEPWLKRIDLLGPEARRALLDFLCPEFQSPLALVDSPANCSTRFWAQLQLKGQVAKSLATHGKRLTFLVPMSGDPEALDSLLDLWEAYGTEADWVVAKNPAAKNHDFADYSASRERSEILKAGGIEIISEPLEPAAADRLASARRSLGYILSPESDIDINYKGFIEAWRTDQDKQLALAAKYLGLPYDLNVGALPQNSRLRRRK
jgi:hypothetical protein